MGGGENPKALTKRGKPPPGILGAKKPLLGETSPRHTFRPGGWEKKKISPFFFPQKE